MEATKCTDSSGTLMQGEHLTATNAAIKDLGLAVDLIYMHGPITTSKLSDKIQTNFPDITPDQAQQLANPSFDLPIGISIPMLKNIKPTDDAEQRLMEEAAPPQPQPQQQHAGNKRTHDEDGDGDEDEDMPAAPPSTTKRARAGPSTELTKLMEAVQGMQGVQQGMHDMRQSLQQDMQGMQQDMQAVQQDMQQQRTGMEGVQRSMQALETSVRSIAIDAAKQAVLEPDTIDSMLDKISGHPRLAEIVEELVDRRVQQIHGKAACLTLAHYHHEAMAQGMMGQLHKAAAANW